MDTVATVTPKLSNALIAQAATLLLAAGRGATDSPACARVGEELNAALLSKVANTTGGKGVGRKGDWYVLDHESQGARPLRGVAECAVALGKNENALRVALSRGGGVFGFTEQTDSGEWAVTLRKATEAEAAEFGTKTA